MSAGLMRGNGNRATWRDETIVDGAVYVLPNGELVRASVEPDPEGMPQYWEKSEDGLRKWSVGKDLRLSVVWSEPRASGSESVGPGRVQFLTAACLARVPWASGYYVQQVNARPEVWRETKVGDGQGRTTRWELMDLVLADEGEAFEYRWAVGRASVALGRLLGEK